MHIYSPYPPSAGTLLSHATHSIVDVCAVGRTELSGFLNCRYSDEIIERFLACPICQPGQGGKAVPQEEGHVGGQVSIVLIARRWGTGVQGFRFMDGASKNNRA